MHLTILCGALYNSSVYFCPPYRFKNKWKAKVTSNQSSIYVPGSVLSLLGISETLLKVSFTQHPLPFQKAAVRWITWPAEWRLDSQAANGSGCISLGPLFNIVLIRMMVSATKNWLVYTILSSQQLISSSVMKGPAVPWNYVGSHNWVFISGPALRVLCIHFFPWFSLFCGLVISIHIWGTRDLVKEVKKSTHSTQLLGGRGGGSNPGLF